jgi:hypothetical protein
MITLKNFLKNNVFGIHNDLVYYILRQAEYSATEDLADIRLSRTPTDWEVAHWFQVSESLYKAFNTRFNDNVAITFKAFDMYFWGCEQVGVPNEENGVLFEMYAEHFICDGTPIKNMSYLKLCAKELKQEKISSIFKSHTIKDVIESYSNKRTIVHLENNSRDPITKTKSKCKLSVSWHTGIFRVDVNGATS